MFLLSFKSLGIVPFENNAWLVLQNALHFLRCPESMLLFHLLMWSSLELGTSIISGAGELLYLVLVWVLGIAHLIPITTRVAEQVAIRAR